MSSIYLFDVKQNDNWLRYDLFKKGEIKKETNQRMLVKKQYDMKNEDLYKQNMDLDMQLKRLKDYNERINDFKKRIVFEKKEYKQKEKLKEQTRDFIRENEISIDKYRKE